MNGGRSGQGLNRVVGSKEVEVRRVELILMKSDERWKLKSLMNMCL